MHIIFNFIYFLVFLVLAFSAMFLGGVSGVAGTFYLMSEPGDMRQNLTLAIVVLSAVWLIILMLRSHNKKVIKRNKLMLQKNKQQNEAVNG